MPIQTGVDSTGCFVRWGDQGKKYYYTCGNDQSKADAQKKAMAQAAAMGEFDKK